MILVGNQRGSASNLAVHLLSPENEHVQVQSVTGFASEDLSEALQEAYALSRGTRCKQFLYSLSLNPPPRESVDTEAFEAVIDRAEHSLGLAGQPRAIVFHEKEGPGGMRRHAHCVWSRIKTDEMKAVQMSYDRKKLVSLSRELFIERGWKIPPGLINSKERSMTNFTLAEWQQAKRAGKNAGEIKKVFQDAWAISDSGPAFMQALAARGYRAARGDRRGFVAVDERGEVYSIPRQAGVNTKDVRARLGDEDKLPGVNNVRDKIAKEMLPVVERHQEELETQKQNQIAKLKQRKAELVESQRAERLALKNQHESRATQEALERQARFRTGLKGLWDRLRGETKRIAALNVREAETAKVRDREEWDGLIARQLERREEFTAERMQARERYIEQRQELARDVEGYKHMRLSPEPEAPARPERPPPQMYQPSQAPPDDQKRAYIEKRQQQFGRLKPRWQQAPDQQPPPNSGPAPKP